MNPVRSIGVGEQVNYSLFENIIRQTSNGVKKIKPKTIFKITWIVLISLVAVSTILFSVGTSALFSR